MASCCHATLKTQPGSPTVAFCTRLILATILLAVFTQAAPAQAPEGEDVYYSRYLEFRIPFQAKDPRIREVLLHCSEDRGHTWKAVATAAPTGDGFRFSARKDGWYYFTVQTRDFENRLFPATLDQAKPGLRVCVDTQPPVVRLDPITPHDGGVGVKWDVRDENLDLKSLLLEYRPGGTAEWLRLDAQRIAAGQHAWNPATNVALEVRLQVRDLAGNAGTATTTIPAGERPRGTAGHPSDDPIPAQRSPTFSGNVRYVNSKRITLNYELTNFGKSGVSIVELWMTLDGRSWQMEHSQNNPKPPFEFEVTDERRYGFTLIAKSGVGLGDPPPRVGDPPQLWVEVDITKPVVVLDGIEVGRGAEAGNLTIRYRASDRNLTDKPITILYAEKADGEWKPIVKGEDNTGRFVWKMPADVPYQMFIRVEAADKAGNIGAQDTTQPIAVDLSQPKVRVLDVGPAGK
jgi:hypothetical protein